jgi:hypothetical protein
MKGSDSFMWWSVGSDGPCSPTTHICKSKPLDKLGDSRFNIHQMRWAYWVVKQNAVKVKQISTGLEFVALIPYYHMFDKRLGSGGGITFDLDGTVSVRAGRDQEEGFPVGIHPGNLSDAEFFLRYLKVPRGENDNNEIKLTLPGAIPKGSLSLNIYISLSLSFSVSLSLSLSFSLFLSLSPSLSLSLFLSICLSKYLSISLSH